jgi:hypothetical protein
VTYGAEPVRHEQGDVGPIALAVVAQRAVLGLGVADGAPNLLVIGTPVRAAAAASRGAFVGRFRVTDTPGTSSAARYCTGSARRTTDRNAPEAVAGRRLGDDRFLPDPTRLPSTGLQSSSSCAPAGRATTCSQA